MKKLTIYTGLDGSGKSTRFRKEILNNPDIKYLYEEKEVRNWKLPQIFDLYNQYELLDRCFLFDEIVYSEVYNEESKIDFIEMTKFLENFLKDHIVELKVGINTSKEYEFVHSIREEKVYPDYERSLIGWANLLVDLKEHFKDNENLKIKIFWYNLDLEWSEAFKLILKFKRGVDKNENRK